MPDWVDDERDAYRQRPPLRIHRTTERTPAAKPEPVVLRVPDEERDDDGLVPLSENARTWIAEARATFRPIKERNE